MGDPCGEPRLQIILILISNGVITMVLRGKRRKISKMQVTILRLRKLMHRILIIYSPKIPITTSTSVLSRAIPGNRLLSRAGTTLGLVLIFHQNGIFRSTSKDIALRKDAFVGPFFRMDKTRIFGIICAICYLFYFYYVFWIRVRKKNCTFIK